MLFPIIIHGAIAAIHTLLAYEVHVEMERNGRHSVGVFAFWFSIVLAALYILLVVYGLICYAAV